MVDQVAPPSRDSSIFTAPVRLAEVHVMVWVVADSQVSPPSGDVTVMLGGGGPVMVNSALLTSDANGLDTRTRALAVAVPETFQVVEPEVAVTAGAMVLHLVPPSLDSSTLTLSFVPKPDAVQVIVWVLPTAQLSPPLGEVIAKLGGGGPVMVKFASDTSLTVELPVPVTRMRPLAVAGPVTVQG